MAAAPARASSSMPFFFPTTTVKTKGTTTTMTMHTANIAQLVGCIERMPGRPPMPTAFAVQLVATLSRPAMQEPTMPQTNGNVYLRLTPNMAGSVTPR